MYAHDAAIASIRIMRQAMNDICNKCHEDKEPYESGAFGFLCLDCTIKVMRSNILDYTGMIAQMEYRLKKALEAKAE